MAENVRRMRRIQRENKKKQAESPQPVPVKALWKSSKYDGVTSKFREELKKEVCMKYLPIVTHHGNTDHSCLL